MRTVWNFGEFFYRVPVRLFKIRGTPKYAIRYMQVPNYYILRDQTHEGAISLKKCWVVVSNPCLGLGPSIIKE